MITWSGAYIASQPIQANGAFATAIAPFGTLLILYKRKFLLNERNGNVFIVIHLLSKRGLSFFNECPEFGGSKGGGNPSR
jgi:hypothetical protein